MADVEQKITEKINKLSTVHEVSLVQINLLIKHVNNCRVKGCFDIKECAVIHENIMSLKNSDDEQVIKVASDFLQNTIKVCCARGKLTFKECHEIYTELPM